MAPTIGSIAKTSTTLALAGISADKQKSPALSGKNKGLAIQQKEEDTMIKGQGIGNLTENIVLQPKDKEDEGVLKLKKGTYNALGRLGLMTAQKRTGSEPMHGGPGIINKKI